MAAKNKTRKELIREISLTDMVVWDMEVYPLNVDSMIEEYGEGPFEVVGLRLHDPKILTSHPVSITIKLADGTLHEFGAGEWFKKV